jgi:hypothetical protein
MPFVDGIGKPAGVPCVQLTADARCSLFGSPQRPAVCASLRPSVEMCGDTRDQAVAWLAALELETAPDRARPIDHRADGFDRGL